MSALIDLLDEAMLAQIISFASLSPLNAPFRAICPRFRALIECPKKMTTNDLLGQSACLGSRFMCENAHEWGATNFDWMLQWAAYYGHRELCELAREWGATNFDGMLRSAALSGHRELCILARKWGAAWFNEMLRAAVNGGHRELCPLAREWGAK